MRQKRVKMVYTVLIPWQPCHCSKVPLNRPPSGANWLVYRETGIWWNSMIETRSINSINLLYFQAEEVTIGSRQGRFNSPISPSGKLEEFSRPLVHDKRKAQIWLYSYCMLIQTTVHSCYERAGDHVICYTKKYNHVIFNAWAT